MFTIQTLNKISKVGLDLFSKDLFRITDEAQEKVDALLVRSANLHDMTFSDSVKAIGRAGAGVNNIPIDKCTKQNIVVFNTPGANANAVKELVLGSMFLASRNLMNGIDYVKSLKGNGEAIPDLVEQNKSQFKGYELRGKRLGVVGLGSIGLMVANEAAALGMDVEGFDPFISVNRAWELSRAVKPSISFNKLISTADFLTFHMSLTPDTKNLINKESLQKMKKNCVLLNFARAEIVNEDDIIEALENNQIAMYITDFPTERLLATKNVVSIPHLGASTREAEDNCAIMVAEQIQDFLLNGNIQNSVNFPNCSIDRSGDARLIIANDNVPNMVGQITAILASEKLNILEMINKSRGDLAYNIVDISGACDDSVVTKLKQIEGIRLVRLLK